MTGDEQRLDKVLLALEGLTDSMTDVQNTLYGHPEERRRRDHPGLVADVAEMQASYRDVRAVTRAMWALAGAGGLGLAGTIIAVVLRGV